MLRPRCFYVSYRGHSKRNDWHIKSIKIVEVETGKAFDVEGPDVIIEVYYTSRKVVPPYAPNQIGVIEKISLVKHKTGWKITSIEELR